MTNKQANPNLDAIKSNLQKALKTEAVRDVINVGLLSGGTMAALRGGQGLFSLLSRSGKKLPSRAGISPLPVQYRSHRGEEEEKLGGFSLDDITQKGSIPWYYPAMLTAGIGGGYGGWKLIDKVMDSRRRREMDDEVEDARESFQQAMSSQYKTGSDSELGTALDELFGKLQKSANLWDKIKDSLTPSDDAIGKSLGMYGTYAIPTSILGYLAVKGMTDKGSTSKRLEKAQRNRALKRQQMRPAELYAIPTPIEEGE